MPTCPLRGEDVACMPSESMVFRRAWQKAFGLLAGCPRGCRAVQQDGLPGVVSSLRLDTADAFDVSGPHGLVSDSSDSPAGACFALDRLSGLACPVLMCLDVHCVVGRHAFPARGGVSLLRCALIPWAQARGQPDPALSPCGRGRYCQPRMALSPLATQMAPAMPMTTSRIFRKVC